MGEVKCDKTPSNFERLITYIKDSSNDQPNFNQVAKIQKILDM